MTYRLHMLHKLSDYSSQRTYSEETGLSLSDGRCLATVGSFEPMSVNDLARLSNLNKGQASRAAQALVNCGLVSKKDRPEDGRGVVLTLTAKGRRVWRKTMDLIRLRNEDIFNCLSDKEQAQLSDFLDRLIAHASDDKNDRRGKGGSTQ
jgi:DNA-binding MarR family transcriptional regulator